MLGFLGVIKGGFIEWLLDRSENVKPSSYKKKLPSQRYMI
jgi:hypothetical protein